MGCFSLAHILHDGRRRVQTRDGLAVDRHFGADGGTRTRTGSPPQDFKSCLSTSFTTSARVPNTLILLEEGFASGPDRMLHTWSIRCNSLSSIFNGVRSSPTHACNAEFMPSRDAGFSFVQV